MTAPLPATISSAGNSGAMSPRAGDRGGMCFLSRGSSMIRKRGSATTVGDTTMRRSADTFQWTRSACAVVSICGVMVQTQRSGSIRWGCLAQMDLADRYLVRTTAYGRASSCRVINCRREGAIISAKLTNSFTGRYKRTRHWEKRWALMSSITFHPGRAAGLAHQVRRG
jgi:hypothetical protein